MNKNDFVTKPFEEYLKDKNIGNLNDLPICLSDDVDMFINEYKVENDE